MPRRPALLFGLVAASLVLAADVSALAGAVQ